MAYSSNDPATRLAAIRDAIDRVLTSQEYQTAAGQRQVAARLDHLHAMEQRLEDSVEQESDSVFLGEYER